MTIRIKWLKRNKCICVLHHHTFFRIKQKEFECLTIWVLKPVVYCILWITTCLTNALIRTWTNSHQWTFMQNDTCVRRIYSLFPVTLLLIILFHKIWLKKVNIPLLLRISCSILSKIVLFKKINGLTQKDILLCH